MNHQQEIDAAVAQAGHPYVVVSTRTDAEVRFERVRALAIAFKEADGRVSAFYSEIYAAKLEFGSEAYVRAEVEKQRQIKACLAAQNAYHKACDEFFLNRDERSAT